MSTTQDRLESMLDNSLYRVLNKETKEHLKKLSKEYGEPEATHDEVRAMMDRSLGPRTLSGELSKNRRSCGSS
jgi:hypothetical protein